MRVSGFLFSDNYIFLTVDYGGTGVLFLTVSVYLVYLCVCL